MDSYIIKQNVLALIFIITPLIWLFFIMFPKPNDTQNTIIYKMTISFVFSMILACGLYFNLKTEKPQILKETEELYQQNDINFIDLDELPRVKKTQSQYIPVKPSLVMSIDSFKHNFNAISIYSDEKAVNKKHLLIGNVEIIRPNDEDIFMADINYYLSIIGTTDDAENITEILIYNYKLGKLSNAFFACSIAIQVLNPRMTSEEIKKFLYNDLLELEIKNNTFTFQNEIDKTLTLEKIEYHMYSDGHTVLFGIKPIQKKQTKPLEKYLEKKYTI